MKPSVQASFNTRDSIIYALGIGCKDRRHLYEHADGFESFPTIAIALTLKGSSLDVQPFPPSFFPMSSVPVNGPVLDGERELELFRPLRSSESFWMTVGEKAVYGSGSGTVLQTETILADDSGRAVAKITANTFFVGTKCFDAVGVPRKFTRPVPSDRAPDFIVEEATTPEQAALYRLSGDYNPLHIDPDIASAFGYERPIQHGLCTLGFATRLVIQTCGNNEGSRLSKVACRFSKPTYPGRVLVVEMWKVGSHSVSFRVKDKEAGVVVLDHAYVNFGFKSATAKL